MTSRSAGAPIRRAPSTTRVTEPPARCCRRREQIPAAGRRAAGPRARAVEALPIAANAVVDAPVAQPAKEFLPSERDLATNRRCRDVLDLGEFLDRESWRQLVACEHCVRALSGHLRELRRPLETSVRGVRQAWDPRVSGSHMTRPPPGREVASWHLPNVTQTREPEPIDGRDGAHPARRLPRGCRSCSAWMRARFSRTVGPPCTCVAVSAAGSRVRGLPQACAPTLDWRHCLFDESGMRSSTCSPASCSASDVTGTKPPRLERLASPRGRAGPRREAAAGC